MRLPGTRVSAPSHWIPAFLTVLARSLRCTLLRCQFVLLRWPLVFPNVSSSSV